MSLNSIAFPTGDSGDYYYHQWLPQEPSQSPKAWVHIMHGMAEHSARYQHLAEFLNHQGYLVSADDHRGHGKTGDANGNLYHLADNDGWNQIVDDQWQLIEHLSEQTDLPLIILGHSMGSFMATRLCQIYPDKLQGRFGDQFKGLVLSGSNYTSPWTCKIAALIANIERLRVGKKSISNLLETLSFGAFNDTFKPTRTAKDWLSRDQAVVDAYIADPFCGGALSTQSWYDFLRGLADLSSPKAMAKINSDLPIYIFSGAMDPVGGQGEGVKKLAGVLKDAGVKNITCKLYSDGRHEMLNEVNRSEVYGDFLNWLNDRFE
jgi:alpha-beta hydrolase superfamily lysophospholipase